MKLYAAGHPGSPSAPALPQTARHAPAPATPAQQLRHLMASATPPVTTLEVQPYVFEHGVEAVVADWPNIVAEVQKKRAAELTFR